MSSNAPPTSKPASSGGGGEVMMGIVMGLIVLLVAFPATLGALWARRFMKTKQAMIALLALAGGLVFALVLLAPLKSHVKTSRTALDRGKARDGIIGVVSAGAGALPLLWLYTLPLAPALTMVWDSMRPKSIEEQQDEKAAQAREKVQLTIESAQRRAARGRQASATPKRLADGVDAAALLGAVISGDPVFFAREHKRLLYLNTDIGASSLHMLMAGENGSGKTESLMRFAASIAASTNWDIVFINPKNDQKTMQQFYDLMAFYNRRCRLFPQEPYNGWEGDSGALLSRIMAIPAYATEGAAAYFSDMAEVYLRAVLNTGEAMPSSFEELEERLQYGRLADQYKDDAQGFARVASISPADAKSVFMRFAMMTPKLTMIRGGGWRLSETRAAYFGLPVMANERDSQSVAKFLLEDIKHYLSVRKPKDRRTVFIIDEFSSLGTESVIRLAEMARSLGGIIMLGTQTLAGLGDADQQARIVGNMSVVLHRMSDPLELTKLAGVQKVMQKSQHYQGRQVLKRGTYRMEDEDRIQAQDVRTLPTGCAWIIARGAAAKIQMAMMPDVPTAPIVIQKPRRTPPPVAAAKVHRDNDDTSYGGTSGGPKPGQEPGSGPPPAQTQPQADSDDVSYGGQARTEANNQAEVESQPANGPELAHQADDQTKADDQADDEAQPMATAEDAAEAGDQTESQPAATELAHQPDDQAEADAADDQADEDTEDLTDDDDDRDIPTDPDDEEFSFGSPSGHHGS